MPKSYILVSDEKGIEFYHLTFVRVLSDTTLREPVVPSASKAYSPRPFDERVMLNVSNICDTEY